MKVYRFEYAPKGRVPFRDISSVVSAGLELLKQKTRSVEEKGPQLLCCQAVDGPLRPTQSRDPIAVGFMDADLLEGTEMRLTFASVEYHDISLPYGERYNTQIPAGIFCRQPCEEKWDAPVYITCCPKSRSVILWAQIVEEESLALCQRAFYTLLQGVEERLVDSALFHGQLLSSLRAWEIRALILKKV
ncbi:MAG: hypothetical protein Q7S04_04395 [Candidatus Moranbacteria bacterium]|nr:hypothetical protein [Candidatus Moranbacteria bacterium]